MSTEIDAPAILATLIVLGILIGSAMLWYKSSNTASALYPEHSVPAWPIGWINFGIFICAIIAALAFFQQLAGFFFASMIDAADGELTTGLAIVSVLTLQLPMLLVFYGARRFYPGHYAGRLNDRALGLFRAIRIAVPTFIQFLPVIWISSLIWGTVLQGLQSQGIIDELPQQELVTLFSQGGSFLPVTILTLCAIVLAPIVEEIIFRGCVYRFLKSQSTPLIAQVLSGLFFGVMHANLLSFVPLVVVGVLLARIYERSGNILVPICFHACFNGFNLLLLFIMSQSNFSG